MEREISMDVDLGGIPGDAAQRIQGLLTESNFFDIPTVNNLHASPDEHEYTITIIAGNSLYTVHVTDNSMPESIRLLVEELTELAEEVT